MILVKIILDCFAVDNGESQRKGLCVFTLFTKTLFYYLQILHHLNVIPQIFLFHIFMVYRHDQF